MKIKSRFKDYYDYVEHANGGGDPLCVYMRDKIRPDVRAAYGTQHEMCEALLEIEGLPSIPRSRHLKDADGNDTDVVVSYKGLMVAGRCFRIRQDLIPFKASAVVLRAEKIVKDWHIAPDEWNNFRQGQALNVYVPACIEVGHPVFLYDDKGPYYNRHTVYGHTPKLGPLGLAQYISAEQLYQEIAFFISNVLKPIEVASAPLPDIQKVDSHGFDRKVSFRHRK